MRLVRAALVLGASLVLLTAVPVAAATPPVVASGSDPFSGCVADDAAAQISTGSVLYPGSEVEPRSAINPTNPMNIVAAYQQDRWSDGGARGITVARTSDGGLTWGQAPLPGVTKCAGGRYDRASDPWVSFSPDGTVHAIVLAFDWFDWHNAILASSSSNGGLTWTAPVEITADDTAGLDKESITADPYRQGVVYAVWDRVIGPGGSAHTPDNGYFHASSYKSQTFLAQSSDGGATWSAPRQIFTTASYSGSIGNIVRVLSDGTLLDSALIYGSGSWKGGKCGSVSVLRSRDGGATWSQKPAIIAPVNCPYQGAADPDTGLPIRSGWLPDIAVSGNTAYVTWEDSSSAASTVGRVWVSRSTDGGVTWSAPITVGGTPASVSAFVPSVAIASDGTVGISYYDFRNDTTANGSGATDMWLVRCASACDTAAGWSAETRITPTSFDIHSAPRAHAEFLGDYQGLTTNGSTFQPFFIATVSPSDPTDAFFATAP